MNQVSIVYCKPCGYLKRAEAAADSITKELGVPASHEIVAAVAGAAAADRALGAANRVTRPRRAQGKRTRRRSRRASRRCRPP